MSEELKKDFFTLSEEDVEKPSKKNKLKKNKKPFFKRPAGIILIVVLVLIIGGGVTCYALRNQILKAVLGPVNYYVYKEGMNISAIAKEDFSVKGNLALGQDYKSILSFTGADSSDIAVDVERSVEKDKLKAEFNVFNIMDYELLIDGNYLSSSINESEPYVINLKEKAPKKKSSSSKKKKATATSTTATTTVPTTLNKEDYDVGKIELAKWAYTFSKECISGKIEDGFIKESTKEFKGMECDVTTFTFNNKLFANILSSIADKMKTDEETQKVVKYFYYNVLGGKSEKFDPKSIAETLEDNAKNLSKKKDKDIVYSVYYYDNEIVNRVNDNTNIGTFTKGDKKYLSIGNKSTLYGELLISDTPNVSDIKIDKSKVQSSGEEFKNSMTGIFKTSVSFVLRSVFGEEVGKAIADYIM
nr:hypothetical protein [uncultured Ruminococcus sp.]